MKYMPRKLVTARKQTRAAFGYGTSVFHDGMEFGIIARTMTDLERIFHYIVGENHCFTRKKVTRVLWTPAKAATSMKSLKWPPKRLSGNGSGSKP